MPTIVGGHGVAHAVEAISMHLGDVLGVLVVRRGLRGGLQDPRRGGWTRLEHSCCSGLLRV
jgi:hypothetical protein